MASVRIISATGRLKNKIDFSYEVSPRYPDFITESGMIYTTDPAMLTGIITLQFGYGATGIISTTFTGIPNGTYYVKAYAYDDTSFVTVYSAAQKVFVTDKGYEISTTGLTIASPLVIAEGTEGVEKVLTSDSSGLSKWKPIKSLFTFGHYIGELYGGGIVVDVWKEADDEKVLIASLEDLTFDYYNGDGIEAKSQFDWSTGVAGTSAVGTGAQSLYNGKQNTNAIIAQSITLGTVYNKNGYAGSAAQVCADYRGGGYEDWYLPAYYELNAIYNQSAVLNKVLGYDNVFGLFYGDAEWLTTTYWSSTEAIFSELSSRYAYIAQLGNMTPFNKINPRGHLPKIRAVRKESIYTGDGLCLNLDTTNIKSFDDVRYSNGMESRWVDLVNSGMASSYSFMPTAWPTIASGGTLTEILTRLDTLGGNSENLTLRRVPSNAGVWTVDKVSGTSTPWLYNKTGASSMVSDFFTIPTQTNTFYYVKFDTIDVSTVKSSTKATVNVYVSVNSGAYTLIREVTNTVGDNNNQGGGGSSVIVSLDQFRGKSVSIKITAPNAYHIGSTDQAGPAVDNIYVYSATGGYQPTGPIYLPSESGFLRFNGTGSMTNESTSFGSYFDINAPIGNATTVTVEMWMRMKDNYQTRMPFAWSKYSIFTGATGGLGFNTGNSDLFGISNTKVQSSGILENWAHYVFEMRSDVSYTNNKMYINGNEQVLSQVAGVEDSTERKFNGGVGRIGGWRSLVNNKLYLFRGDISVVRIYNRPLTKDEIMKNYSTEKKKYEILPKLLENNLFTSIDFDNRASFFGDGTITREVVDLSRNSRNASLIISGTTIKPSVVRTNSLYNGRELVFPGEIATNPYFSWPDSDNNSAIQSLQNISVSFWIKFGINRTSEIIVKWNSSTGTIGPWEVYQSSTTTIAIRLKGQLSGTSYQVDRLGLKQIALNKWTHVCMTYDNTTKNIKTYIDSVIDIDSSAPFGFSISTGITGEICVGRYVTAINNLFYPFQGSIASIQIYDKPLTSGEIKNNYDADKFRFDNFSDANKFFSHEFNGNPTFSIYENLVLDVSGKSNDKILSSNSEGKASWVDKSYFFDRPINYRYIGELYGGGIIVAMWKYPSTVFNYLIMSLEDVSASTPWSNQIANSNDVTIGTQTWTLKNLSVTTYRNGDTIPQVTDNTQWENLTTGAWCYYNNDPSTEATYGRLYNWYAINDPRGIGPVGYHVPSDNEWTVLTNYLGGESVAGGKMKEVGTTRWLTPNTGATNISGFTALPAGYRYIFGDQFDFIRENATFWSSTEDNNNPGDFWIRNLEYNLNSVSRFSVSKENGHSIRLIKDFSSQFVATTASSIHNGSSNTNTIISQPWHVSSAAKLCKDYRGGGYTDWYLPSLTELNHGFNAGSVVGTVLGSDILKGSYWTSTEKDSANAYLYDFAHTDSFGGSKVFDSEKNVTNKVRAFRLAQVNERRRPWYPEWEPDYTPLWWGDGTSWWDDGNFRFTTTISIGIPTNSQSFYIGGGLSFTNPKTITERSAIAFVFSNTITTNETIIRSGVCWSTTSATPTISGSVSYSSGPNSYVVTTPYVFGPPVGTVWNQYDLTQIPTVYYRAFVETATGVYYSSNSGQNISGTTYSTSPTSYAYWPTGCYIGSSYYKSLYE